MKGRSSFLTTMLLCGILLFAALVAFVNVTSYRQEIESVENYTNARMNSLILNLEVKTVFIESTLESEARKDNWAIDRREALYEHLEDIVRKKNFINNACIDFGKKRAVFDDPDAVSKTFYVGRNSDGEIERMYRLIRDEEVDRSEIEAFREAVTTGEPAWSQPYYDSLFTRSYVLTCYQECKTDGMVLSADVQTSTLLCDIDSLQFYEDSKMYIVSEDGDTYTLEEGSLCRVDSLVFDDDKQIKISGHCPNLNIDIVDIVPKGQIYSSMWNMVLFLFIILISGLSALSLLVHKYFKKSQEDLAASIRKAGAEEAELKRIERELSIAAGIQNRMLTSPGKAVHLASPGAVAVDIMSSIIPAREVGGDLYEYRMVGHNLVMCIADVSGKGIPASVIMTKCCTLFHAFFSGAPDPDPAESLKYMNVQLCRGNDDARFVTMWVGVLDVRSGSLKYSSAGHNRPVAFRHGVCSMLDACQGLPLGLFEDAVYSTRSCTLDKGDALLLYTDGITEAEGPGKVLFGDEKLLETCREAVSYSPLVICNAVLGAVHSHTCGCAQSDDITLLCVSFGGKYAQLRGIEDIPEINVFCEECGASYRAALSIEELAVNAFQYGGAGFVSVEYSDGAFALLDDGAAFDPTAVEAPAPDEDEGELRVGGLGISIVKKISSEFSYRRLDAGYNLTRLSLLPSPLSADCVHVG